MSCDVNTYAGYHILKPEEISELTDEQERLFWHQLAEMYERNARILMETSIFRNNVEHHEAKRIQVLAGDMFRLKKPIMPNRWISYREGWCSAAWGFTNADLTPYALKEAADKLVEQMKDPNFKQVLRALWLPEGFTLGKEGR